MRFVFARMRGGHPRHILAGVLILLGAGAVVARAMDPDLRIYRVLRRLSPDVQLVIFEPRGTSTEAQSDQIRTLVNAVVGGPLVASVSTIRPRARLLLEGSNGATSVALVDARSARAAGLHGTSVGGFIAVGPHADRAFVDRPADDLDPTVRRFVRSSNRLSVLIRPSWLHRRMPFLSSLASSEPFSALQISGDPEHLRIDGIIPGHGASLGNARPLLALPPQGSLLLLDGVQLSQLLAEHLPQPLDGLVRETGVTAELAALIRRIGETPSVVLLRAASSPTPQVSLGMILPPSVSLVDVREHLRAVLVARLARAKAVVETLRVQGRSITHRRPGGTSSQAGGGLREEQRGAATLLIAPRSVGDDSVVAAVQDRRVVVGTDPEQVLSLADQLRAPEPLRGSPSVRVFLDGDLLRRLPAVHLALQGLHPSLRSWALSLRTFRVTVSRADTAARFTAMFAFRPQ